MNSLIETNKEIVKRFMQVFVVPTDEEAMAIVENLCSKDFYFDDPPLGEEVKGIEGGQKWVAAERAVFGKRKDTLEVILAEGDLVATQAIHSGVYFGEKFYGMGSENKEERALATRVLGIYRIQSGKIRSLVMRYDSHDVLQQMGVLSDGGGVDVS